MPNIHSFAADYSEAREKFLAAAKVAGATTHRYDNPPRARAARRYRPTWRGSGPRTPRRSS